MKEKLTATNVEVATITKEKLFHLYPVEEVEEIIKDL